MKTPKYVHRYNFGNLNTNLWLTNFRQIFALLTPTDSSLTLFMFVIMAANVFLGKTKTLTN